MGFVTNTIIGFYNIKPKKLKKYIKEFLKKEDKYFQYYYNFHRKGSVVKVSSGTKGPAYTVVAGGFNYVNPSTFFDMCEWLHKEKNICCEGIITREDWNGRYEQIICNTWTDETKHEEE